MQAKARAARRAPSPPFSPHAFFEQWQVFTYEAFRQAHARTGVAAVTTKMLLSAEVASGHLLRLRRGLFAVPGAVDPYVVASRLTPDGVLAYDGALSFHHLGPLGARVSFLSYSRCRAFALDELAFQAVRPARSLKRRTALVDGVEARQSGDQTVKVTSRERTLVDALDRLDLVPSPWVVVKAIRAARRLDVEAMVEHALALAHSLTAARLGHVLETKGWGTPAQLRRLEALAPESPVYFDTATRSEPSHFERRWHLVVPEWVPNGLRGQADFGDEGPPWRAT